MAALDTTAGQLRELLASLPHAAHSGISERSRGEIDQTDDYIIDWEISAHPTDPRACPLDIFASYSPEGRSAWGFAFDTRARIAPILGAKQRRRTGHVVAFGTEPVPIASETVVAIAEAVIGGKVELHWWSLAGRLTKTSGVVLLSEAPHPFWGYGLPVGKRRVFTYSPWRQAAQQAYLDSPGQA